MVMEEYFIKLFRKYFHRIKGKIFSVESVEKYL